jgi:hypothetical protein
VVEIPALSVTGSSKDSGTSVIPSGPSAAQIAAQALAAKLGSKATVTGDGTVVTLTADVAITKDDEFEIPTGVTLAVASGKTLTVASSATFEVAEGATLDIAAGSVEGPITNNGTINLGTSGSISDYSKVTNTNGTIKTADADGSTLEALLDEADGVTAGTVEVSGNVVLPGTATQTVKAGTTLKVSAKLTVPSGTGLTIGTGIEDGAKLNVEAGATVSVSGTLTLAQDVTDADENPTASDRGVLNGTLVIESTGVFQDLSYGQGALWGDGPSEGTGSITIKAGGKAYTYTGVQMISNVDSTTSDSPSSLVLIKLTTGEFTLKKAEYILNGTATLQGGFGISSDMALLLKEGSKLTINTSWNNESYSLYVADGATVTVKGTLDLSATTAKPVQLDGELVVEGSGTLNLSLGNGSGVIPEIDWDDSEGSLKIEKGGKVTLEGVVQGQSLEVIYVGAHTDANALYQWDEDGPATGSVTLSENAMAISGNITAKRPPAIGATITATITEGSKLTLNEDTNEHQTIAGKLVVEDRATLLVTKGSILLDNTTSELVLEPGAILSVAQGSTGIMGWYTDGSTTANEAVKLTVAAESGTNAQVKAEKTPANSTNWTVSIVSSGGSTVTGGDTIKLGGLQLSFTSTAAVTDVPCLGTAGPVANWPAGTLKAGDNTVITFKGANDEE